MARLQLPNPPPSSPAVRAAMRANRARDTSPERALRKALRQAGFPGYRLNWRGAIGRPDIAYPGRRVAVFVHGCFWHHCPRCYPNLPRTNQAFWARKFELNRERDARKVRQLRDLGWTALEVWECDVATDAASVAARIGAALGQHSDATPSDGRRRTTAT